MSRRRARTALVLALAIALPTFASRPACAQQKAAAAAESDEESPWEESLDARDAELIQQYGDGTDKALHTRLLKMRDLDQNIRKRAFTDQSFDSLPADTQNKLHNEMAAIDTDLTAQLKQIVATNGWPTIPLVGLEASNAASVILVHSADHDWQKSLLPRLQQLVSQGKIQGLDIAGLVDTTLKADGKPQRFGTAFVFKNGVMTLWPVENPANLDKLREQYSLPPMAEYRKLMEQMYHMKVQ